MPMSSYPTGWPYGVNIRGIPLLQTQPGRVFWLNNSTTGLDGNTQKRGGSNQNKGTFDSPFATLAYAITQCVAGRGDIIMVKPGHAESISSSTALTLSISHVAIIGLGQGSARPTFTIDTANTATINVTADNISFVNCRVIGNFLSIAAAFTLTTAKWFTLQDCFIADTSAVLNFLNVIKSTGAANTVDGLSATNNRWNGLGTTSVNSFILTADAVDSPTVTGNVVTLARTAAAAVIWTSTTGDCTNAIISDNVAISKQTADTGGGLISVTGTGSTGIVARNYLGDLATTTDLICIATVGFRFHENRKTGVITTSGFLLPTADS